MLEPDTFDRIPEGHGLVDRAQLLPVADRARRDLRRLRLRRLLDRHRHAGEVPAGAPRHHGRPVSPRRRSPARPAARGSRRRRGSRRASSCTGPCFVDEGAVSRPGARILPYSVIGRQTPRGRRRRRSTASIIWPNGWIGREAIVHGSILGRNCHIGRNAVLGTPVGARRQDRHHRLQQAMTTINPVIFKAYDVRGLYPVGSQRRRRAPDRPRLRQLSRGEAHRRVARHAAVLAVASPRRSSTAPASRAPTSSTTG